MNINADLSRKIKILSFISIVLVVYLHSINLTIRFLNDVQTLASFNLNGFVQIFISDGIARIAVPLFFLISGYLSFWDFKATPDNFILKYKKRFFSLVVPFLIWSLWGILVFYILQSIPAFKAFFTHELIKDYPIGKMLNAIFLNPIPYQLWFIRDLIIFTILSPLIYFFVSRISYFSIIFLLFLWFFNVDLLYISNIGILFFSLGSFLAIKRIDMNPLKKKFPKLIRLVFWAWMALLFIKTYREAKGLPGTNYLGSLSIMTGLLAVWFNYDVLCGKKWLEEKIFYLSAYTFFLYAFHEPVLTILKKGILKVIGVSPYSNLFAYLVAPILTILFSISVAIILKKHANRFYKIITGGRSEAISLSPR